MKCAAEAGGYDGMFGVYCNLPEGHDGLHDDGIIEWRFADPGREPQPAPRDTPTVDGA